MLWIVLLAVVLGLVFFKLGVLTVWFSLLQGLVKVLGVITGAFLLLAGWRWLQRRPVTIDVRR